MFFWMPGQAKGVDRTVQQHCFFIVSKSRYLFYHLLPSVIDQYNADSRQCIQQIEKNIHNEPHNKIPYHYIYAEEWYLGMLFGQNI